MPREPPSMSTRTGVTAAPLPFEKCSSRQSPSFAWRASSANRIRFSSAVASALEADGTGRLKPAAPSSSNRLQRAEDVDHAGPLKTALAPEIGRRRAQDFLHAPRLADELAMPRQQQRRCPAH